VLGIKILIMILVTEPYVMHIMKEVSRKCHNKGYWGVHEQGT